MNIKITETARERLDKALTESEFQNPALRIIFSGYG
jgi:Fe-S cluster assembly iron-binding protein IscA